MDSILSVTGTVLRSTSTVTRLPLTFTNKQIGITKAIQIPHHIGIIKGVSIIIKSELKF